jgi:ACT domain
LPCSNERRVFRWPKSQLTVSLESQLGRLAAVAKVLADAKVNILAVLSSTAGEKAYGTVSKGAKKSVLYFAMSCGIARRFTHAG